ncbi:MAG: penicillin-binding protein activator [Mariprofundaceae bacterium]
MQKKELAYTPTSKDTRPSISHHVEPLPQISGGITLLMLQARQAGNVAGALASLSELIKTAPFPINEEAAFKRVELLLEFNHPSAFDESNKLLEQYPLHALTPDLRFQIATWWYNQEEFSLALDELKQVIQHPRLTPYLSNQALQSGFFIAQRSNEWNAILWLFATAEADPKQQDYWLRTAAERASMVSIQRLYHEQRITDAFQSFYLHAARGRLMRGAMDELQSIANILAISKPYSSITRKVERWTSGMTQRVTIGVLLPLSGPHAHFGLEALQGIRMAMSSNAYANNITLQIEDTGAGAQACISAYKHLIQSDVSWVLGPLLAEHTQALTPFLRSNIPVISLTSRSQLAERSNALFIHSIARNIQATFLAKHAWHKGLQRIAIIEDSGVSSSKEAGTFITTFEALGGEIIERLTLEDSIDNRAQLQGLRERTDDEELLASLDEDLILFSPEPDMEIRLPVNIDAVYLALSGKRVASLAGQLAYIDLSGIPLYGSNRWQDGQLMNDRGRYLHTSKFIQINFPEVENDTTKQLVLKYRDIWGNKKPSGLFGIAYDSASIAAVVASRLGLYGNQAIQALHAREGFPGLTGYVYFDEQGLGHKSFNLYRVHRGNIVSAN